MTQSPLPHIPATWVQVPVKDVFKIVGGGTPSTTKPEYWQGDIPWISSADIDESGKITPRRAVTADAIKSSATNLVPAGSLIVVTRVGLGKVGTAVTDLCFSQDSQALLFNPAIVNSTFVAYQMRVAVSEFKYISRGTTISGVTVKQLQEVSFSLAPLPEQHRIIAEIERQFSLLDAGVANLQRVQASLKRYRASVLQAACEGRLVPTEAALAQEEGRDYEPAAVLLTRILAERRARWEAEQWTKKGRSKESKPVGEAKGQGDSTAALPLTFNERVSGLDTLEVVAGSTVEQLFRKQPGSDLEEDPRLFSRQFRYDLRGYKEPAAPDTSGLPELPEGWVLASIGQISECLDYKRVPINKEERLKRQGSVPYFGANGQVGWIDDYLFDEPLVLVVEDETFTGREKPFSYKITGRTWVNNHAHVLRATDAVYVDYLNYSLSYYPFTPLTTGTTGRKKLVQARLMSAPYGLPPLAEQERIVAEVERRLSVVDNLEQVVTANLKRAERLRQAVLKEAFAGRLVPQDPADEPAGVLLERIKAEREAQTKAPAKAGRRKETPDADHRHEDAAGTAVSSRNARRLRGTADQAQLQPDLFSPNGA